MAHSKLAHAEGGSVVLKDAQRREEEIDEFQN